MRPFLRFTVLAASIAIVCGGWQWSRSYVARGVGQRAERRPETATVAFSELAQLGDDALPALLDAAVNPDRQVAAPARRQVESLMVSWSGRRSARRLGQTAAGYERVIDGLLARERQLTPSGRRWARQLGEASLRLAAGSRPLDGVGSVDDALLEKTQRLFDALQGISQVSDLHLNYRPYVAEATNPLRAAQPIAAIPSRETAIAPPAQPDPITPLGDGPSLAAESPPVSSPAVAQSQPAAGAPKPFVPAAAPAAPKASGPPSLAWRRPPASSDSASENGKEPAGKLSPIQNEPQKLAVESEDSPPEAVKQLMQGDEADRLLLVEQLLTGKHVSAAQLLLELAKDPAPRVRASAISALGSSSNRQLTEAAWRLAMHDEDPRVASLAGQLEKLLR